MAEKRDGNEKIFTIDGEDFDASNIAEKSGALLKNLDFIDEQILQKNNELQIVDSARIIYTSVLKKELLSK